MKVKENQKKLGLSLNVPKKETKKYSKTWLAIIEHKGNGKILDMKAVLK